MPPEAAAQQLLSSRSTGRHVCWVVLGLYVPPLVRLSVLADFLHPVGDEYVEALRLIPHVTEDSTTVGPEVLVVVADR